MPVLNHANAASQNVKYGQPTTKNQQRSRYKHQSAGTEPKRKLQAGNRQKPIAKQVQAPNRTNGAEIEITGKQPPNTNHDAGTIAKSQERAKHKVSIGKKPRKTAGTEQKRNYRRQPLKTNDEAGAPNSGTTTKLVQAHQTTGMEPNQAGNRKNKYNHQTTETTNRQENAKKQQRSSYKQQTAGTDPKQKLQLGNHQKTTTKQLQAPSSRNPKQKVQVDNRQKLTAKQVQVPHRRNRAETEITGGQPPKTTTKQLQEPVCWRLYPW